MEKSQDLAHVAAGMHQSQMEGYHRSLKSQKDQVSDYNRVSKSID